MERGGLWLLQGQQVQHRSERGSWVSEIHIWFHVTNVEERIRDTQKRHPGLPLVLGSIRGLE